MANNVTKPKANINLKEFWENTKPINLLYGGRDSSKTKDTAVQLVVRSLSCKMRIMCTRQFQNKIEDSVYTELIWAINHLGVKDIFKITNKKIICEVTGSEFSFYGIRRNIEQIKGTANIDVLWIEEGEDLTEAQFDLIEPTIRREGSIIIILFNPKLVTDFVWSKLVNSKRDDIQKKHINYIDNPFLTEKSRKRIENVREEDYEKYEHLYLGQPKRDDNESIIKRRWLLECIDAHKTLNIYVGTSINIGYDVADDGEDTNACSVMKGCLLTELDEWKGEEDELFDSSEKVYNRALKLNGHIIYDANGVGAGVGSNIKKLNNDNGTYIEYTAFDSASSPRNHKDFYIVDGEDTQVTNAEYFENRKAQAWWNLADKVKATYKAVTKNEPIDPEDAFCISGDLKNIEELITQLSTPRKRESQNEKSMVERKKDLKARGVKSPNLADAVVYSSFGAEPNSDSYGFMNNIF